MADKRYMELCQPEVHPSWKELLKGCVVDQPGSASTYRSGDWKSERPVWDFTKCIKCGMCNIVCPDVCVHYNESGYLEADLFYCKGCGICAVECPKQVITMVAEEEEE